MSRSGSPGRPDPGGRRAELVAAAARVLAADGVAAATTRRIAEEAGVPLGTVHYWFATKDDLLAEVVADHTARLAGTVLDPAGPAGAAGRLHALLAADRAAGREGRLAQYELAVWSLRHPGRADLAREQVRGHRALARTAVQAWAAPPGDGGAPQDAAGQDATGQDAAGESVDHDVLAQLVTALLDGLALAELSDPAGSRSGEVLDLLARWLEPPPDPPRPRGPR